MAETLGTLIKQARTGAKLTQEQLAKQIEGMSAADISKAERGEKIPSQSQLKAIAKATGVTQASLLKAAKEESAGEPAAEKKKSGSGSTGKKTDTAELKLSATEKKLVELYRAADKDTRDAAVRLLKGEEPDLLGTLVSGAMNLIENLGKK